MFDRSTNSFPKSYIFKTFNSKKLIVERQPSTKYSSRRNIPWPITAKDIRRDRTRTRYYTIFDCRPEELSLALQTDKHMRIHNNNTSGRVLW